MGKDDMVDDDVEISDFDSDDESGRERKHSRKEQLQDPSKLDPAQLALAQYITGTVRNDLLGVKSDLSKVSKKLGKVESSVNLQDGRISTLETEMASLRKIVESDSRPCSESGMSSTGGIPSASASRPTPANPYTGDRRVDKCLLTAGGWPQDSLRATIESQARQAFAQHSDNIRDLWAPGQYGTVCKIRFKEPDQMWAVIRQFKGAKIPVPNTTTQLWIATDKTDYEILMSKQLKVALNAIRAELVSQSLVTPADTQSYKNFVEINWKLGIIYKKPGPGESAVRLVEKLRPSHMYAVCDSWPTGFLAGIDKQAMIDEMNGASL